MKKGKHKIKPVTYIEVIGSLQGMANIKTTVLGHLVGQWQPAKKKHGVGAMRAWCLVCGADVFIMPRMEYQGENKVRVLVPGMKGEALFDKCQEPEHVH